jgi:CRP-like cAMP-binding protein
VLKENPELARRLSELLAHRKMETEGLIAAHANEDKVVEKRDEYARGILRRITALFEI